MEKKFVIVTVNWYVFKVCECDLLVSFLHTVPRTVSIDYIAVSKDDHAIHQCLCSSAAIAARAPHLNIIMGNCIHYDNE